MDDKCREYYRKWRQKNASKLSEKNRQWRLDNPQYAKTYRENPENKKRMEEYRKNYNNL